MTKTENTSIYKKQDSIPVKLRLLQAYIKTLCYIWPSQALDFLVDLFATPRTSNEKIIERCEKEGVFEVGKKEFLELLGDKLFIYTEGDRSPEVLLVPGWESSAYRFVDIIEELRANKISFLFFDLPAQGQSEGTHNNAVKTSKIIQSLLQRTPSINTIIGHSFGGGSAYLALSRKENSDLDHVKTLITISSPTSYKSVINHFVNFLGVPEKTHDELLDKISEYIEYDFREYNWKTMKKPQDVDVHVFHDLDDPTIPVRDAVRINKMFDVTITEGNGHSGIMHDPDVLSEVINLTTEQVFTSREQ